MGYLFGKTAYRHVPVFPVKPDKIHKAVHFRVKERPCGINGCPEVSPRMDGFQDAQELLKIMYQCISQVRYEIRV
jgi:hypothetical protein